MNEIQKGNKEIEFLFVPNDFYVTFKDAVKEWYAGFCYNFPNRIPEAQLFSLDHPKGFEFENTLAWFAGSLLEIMEQESLLNHASLHDLSMVERMWFEYDLRVLLDSESITYIYGDEVHNAIITEVW